MPAYGFAGLSRLTYAFMRTTIAVMLGVSLVVGASVVGSYFHRSRAQHNAIRVVGATD
jgi:hypothetical protein